MRVDGSANHPRCVVRGAPRGVPSPPDRSHCEVIVAPLATHECLSAVVDRGVRVKRIPPAPAAGPTRSRRAWRPTATTRPRATTGWQPGWCCAPRRRGGATWYCEEVTRTWRRALARRGHSPPEEAAMNYTFEVFQSGEDGMWRYRMVANPRSWLREVMREPGLSVRRRGACAVRSLRQQAAAEAPSRWSRRRDARRTWSELPSTS